MPNYEIEIKSPVHIGNGESWSALSDFVSIGAKVYFLDSEKIFEYLMDYKIPKEKKKIVSFSSLINTNKDVVNPVEEYLNIIRGKVNEKGNIKPILKDYFAQKDIDHKLSQEFIEKYVKNTYYIDKLDNNVDIEKHIKSANRVYIPGSSIKGAIRTALVYKENDLGDIKNKNVNISPFGNYEKDLFKNLLVGDTEFVPKENLGIKHIRVELLNSEKNRLSVFCETIDSGSYEFRIKTKGTNLNFSYLNEGNETELLKYVDNFYKIRLKKEMDIFSENKNYETIRIQYQELLESIKDGEYLIRLGKNKSIYDQTMLEIMDEEQALKIINEIRTKAKLTPILVL